MDMKKQAINHEVNCLFYSGAANEARTRDPQLGKLMLYQLSYYRVMSFFDCKVNAFFDNVKEKWILF